MNSHNQNPGKVTPPRSQTGVLSYVRRHLRRKLFLSHLVVIVVGPAVLASKRACASPASR